MTPYSPESRKLYVNQERHRQHAALIVSPTTHAINFSDRFHNVKKIKNECLSVHRSSQIKHSKQSLEKNQTFQATYADLSRLAYDVLYQLQQTSTEAKKTKHGFKFLLNGVEEVDLNGRKKKLVDVSLDFSESLLSYRSIRRVVNTIQRMPNYNELFFVGKTHLGQPTHLYMFLEALREEILKSPETSDQTKRLAKEEGCHLFHGTLIKKNNPYASVPWTLSLDFAHSILNQDEIQYVLWKLSILPQYMVGHTSGFDISSLDLTNTSVNFKTLIEEDPPNAQYPQVQGHTLGVFLHLTLERLNLSHCKIGPEILKPLSLFQTLKTLYLNGCTQEINNTITRKEIQEACPLLNLLETKKWNLVDFFEQPEENAGDLWL